MKRLLVACCIVQALMVSAQKEQATFAPEGREITRPIKLPDSAIRLLEKNDFIRQALENVEGSSSKLPDDWIIASTIHLGPSGEVDYVVAGEKFLLGAHSQHYWLVRMTTNGPKIALHYFGDGFEVLKTKHHGFRDVRGMYFAAGFVYTSDFHYLNGVYKVVSQHKDEIKPL